ncbi:MAG: hypothetical protein IJR55_00065 [Clostridia bacterium]|nr:hypothetical protein [Clostridia bacterium]
MLEIKPIQEKEEQKRLCDMCGAEYKENYFAYGASVDGEPVGICQFYIKGNYGHIFDLKNVKDVSDTEALFIMARGVLNFIDLAGAHEAFYDGEDSPLIHAVGFGEKDGKLYMDLGKFFAAPCKNAK